MGVVMAARHVALKFLLPEALSSEEAVARFLREARASVRIKSEHVARVHDVGTLETGAPYIVMEYLEGSDLAAIVRERGACAVEDVVDYVAQACEAMAGAHASASCTAISSRRTRCSCDATTGRVREGPRLPWRDAGAALDRRWHVHGR
jgi:serine/threonine protein kinase